MGMQFVVEDAPDLTIPEDTIVRGKLVELKHEVVPYTDRKGQPASFEKLTWWFEVIGEGQYAGRKIKGETDAKISNHPRNRFRQWAETLLGRELPVGMALDVDDLLGLVVDFTVRHDRDKKDSSKIWERVDDLLPIDGGFSLSDEPPF